MFSELIWLGAILLGLAVLVVVAPRLWMIVRASRDRSDAHEYHPHGSRFRRIDPHDNQS